MALIGLSSHLLTVYTHTHKLPSLQVVNGPHYDDEFDLNGYDFPGDELLDRDDVVLPSLADLSPSTDSRYQSHTLHCDSNGQFGFTLRHFSIQPNAGMVSRSSHVNLSPPAHVQRGKSRGGCEALRHDGGSYQIVFVHFHIAGYLPQGKGEGEGEGVGAGKEEGSS